MYKIVFTQRALKDLENIDKEIQSRIATKLKEYALLKMRPPRSLRSLAVTEKESLRALAWQSRN